MLETMRRAFELELRYEVDLLKVAATICQTLNG
jgi:hypothetical protein